MVLLFGLSCGNKSIQNQMVASVNMDSYTSRTQTNCTNTHEDSLVLVVFIKKSLVSNIYIALSIFEVITLIVDGTAGVHFSVKNTPTSIDLCTFLPLYKHQLLRSHTVYS